MSVRWQTWPAETCRLQPKKEALPLPISCSPTTEPCICTVFSPMLRASNATTLTLQLDDEALLKIHHLTAA